MYFLSKFQVCYTVPLTTVIMLYIIRSSELIHFLSENLYPFANISLFVPPPKSLAKSLSSFFLDFWLSTDPFCSMVTDPLRSIMYTSLSSQGHPGMFCYTHGYRYNRKFICFSNSFSESGRASNFEESHFVTEVLRSSALLRLWTRVNPRSSLRVTHRHTNKKVSIWICI